MIANNILNSITHSDGAKTAILKAVNQILIGRESEATSVLELFEFESDTSFAIQINDWWKICMDRPCFPVANFVSGQDYLLDERMKVFGGYIISPHDTTIPVYQDNVKVGIRFDLLSSCIASCLNQDYQFANLCLQAFKQFDKYFSLEERIEEVNNCIVDEIDCYVL